MVFYMSFPTSFPHLVQTPSRKGGQTQTSYNKVGLIPAAHTHPDPDEDWNSLCSTATHEGWPRSDSKRCYSRHVALTQNWSHSQNRIQSLGGSGFAGTRLATVTVHLIFVPLEKYWIAITFGCTGKFYRKAAVLFVQISLALCSQSDRFHSPCIDRGQSGDCADFARSITWMEMKLGLTQTGSFKHFLRFSLDATKLVTLFFRSPILFESW